eukprot:TRINITY_DN67063_c1_g2_i1.p1 TRINITY_DN67063_c1_g2~~TRINITY_DN67063_c1_g2_i1.p1  ORF type:complete len:522 (-),score=270.80 TRINITY_DN67063_c1_g2_i1:1690-3234(-)
MVWRLQLFISSRVEFDLWQYLAKHTSVDLEQRSSGARVDALFPHDVAGGGVDLSLQGDQRRLNIDIRTKERKDGCQYWESSVSRGKSLMVNEAVVQNALRAEVRMLKSGSIQSNLLGLYVQALEKSVIDGTAHTLFARRRWARAEAGFSTVFEQSEVEISNSLLLVDEEKNEEHQQSAHHGRSQVVRVTSILVENPDDDVDVAALVAAVRNSCSSGDAENEVFAGSLSELMVHLMNAQSPVMPSAKIDMSVKEVDDDAANNDSGSNNNNSSSATAADEQAEYRHNVPNPDKESFNADAWAGPTDYSNWVVPGRIIVGAWPGVEQDERNDFKPLVLSAGVSLFVSLNGEQPQSSYSTAAQKWYASLPQQTRDEVGVDELQFMEFPIYDFQVAKSVGNFKAFLDRVLDAVFRDGHVAYVHCLGGHGRTGMAASYFIGKVYHLEAQRALKLNQQLHDMRVFASPNRQRKAESPETHEQKRQVMDMLLHVDQKQKRFVVARKHAEKRTLSNSTYHIIG